MEPGMSSVEICPDCSARLPVNSPAGLCPRCLLRLGAALAVDLDAGLGNPEANRVHEDPDKKIGSAWPPTGVLSQDGAIGAIPRVHLRDTSSEDTRLIRPTSPETPKLTGQRSRYQLIGELARGGMGAIFQGRDLDLGRDLAVKVIREEHRDHPEMVRRFVEEAQIGGQLQHPGIIPVHEFGRLPDGRLFIAMKLVRGRTLAALLATRRGPDEDRMRFLSVFEQVCQTMAYAHARGVIHRDLKPSNIMVGSFGEVQVMDWGLAKVLDQGGVADEEKAILASGDASAVCDLAERIVGDGVAPGFGARNAVVHGTRAGTGRTRHTRRAGGCLRPWLDPLRDPDRPAGVCGQRRCGVVPQGGEGRPFGCALHASTRATPTRSW